VQWQLLTSEASTEKMEQMRTHLASLVLGLAFVSCGVVWAQSSAPAPATTPATAPTPAPATNPKSAVAPTPIFVPGEYFQQPAFEQIAGTCATEMSPNQALIVGGVSSSGLKPGDAIDQLEKQLGLMRSYVAEKHGEIETLERVRTLKNPQPGRVDNEPPFQVVQRLQVTFPANAPMDAILEKLIELGFDRYGDNVLNNSNRREVVIRFRITDADERLKSFEKQCTAEAWKQWCSTATDKEICGSKTPPAAMDLQSFNVRSKEALMRPDGGSAPWQFNVNRGQQRSPEVPDLMGNVTVHLIGNINLLYRREAEKP
jgi:hypothetical protein